MPHSETSASLSFPLPKFELGQKVVGKNRWNRIEGTIVGFHFTSHDAALANDTDIGWSYVLETPAFQHRDPHHYFYECEISPQGEFIRE